MSGVDMYVAEGPLPGDAAPQTDRLAAVLDSLVLRMENLEKAMGSKIPEPSGPSRSDSFNTLLVRIEEIAANLIKLQKQVEALPSSSNTTSPAQSAPQPASLPQRPAILYSEKVVRGSGVGGQAKGTKSLPAVPPNSYINRFKLGQVVIRKRFDQPKPFEGLSAAQIAAKINEALNFAEAKINQEPITVKAVAQFPNGDVKVFTKDRPAAKWLLDNKHLWTEKADPKFVTTRTSYPVLLHSCPTSFEVDNKEHITMLCQQNSIDPAQVHRIRWLLNPKLSGKATSTLLVSFLDRRLALDIERAGLCYNSLHLKGQHYLQGPKECYNCLAVGHLAHSCKEKPLCSRCGENHNSASCGGMEDATHSCQRCLNQDKKAAIDIDLADPKYDHSPFSNTCPIRTKELAILSKDKTTPPPQVNDRVPPIITSLRSPLS